VSHYENKVLLDGRLKEIQHVYHTPYPESKPTRPFLNSLMMCT